MASKTFPAKNAFYLFALPKSGGRLVYRALLDAQPPRSKLRLRVPPAPLGIRGFLVNLDVRPEYVRKAGPAFFHSHAAALPLNVELLDLMEIRYLVLLRHPADHLVGLYCHLRRSACVKTPAIPPPATTDRNRLLQLKQFASKRSPGRVWHSVISPVTRPYFENGIAVEDALQHLISDGYLFSALKWMADWLFYRSPARSVVTTYEGLVADPKACLERCYEFLFADAPHGPFPDALPAVGAIDPGIYPRGYSGEAGIWRKYFSTRNVDAYNAVVGKVLDVYPPASRLLELYPALTL